MFTGSDDAEPQGSSKPDGSWDDENPFEQEDIFPAGSAEGEGAANPPLVQGGGSADYMPEDAVIEYGYEGGEDFYDPRKTTQEEDSVFMTEESGMRGDAQGTSQEEDPGATSLIKPTPPPLGDTGGGSGDEYENQLDQMFPDDGFQKDGELDWPQKQEEGGVSLTEPYPAMPPADQPVGPAVTTAEIEEDGVPDSPSGYVVITPSGRKKGLSPEIAQLLDRTSKRQTTVAATDKDKVPGKGGKTGIIILALLLFLAAGAAGYLYTDAQKAHEELSQVATAAQRSAAILQNDHAAAIKKADTEKQGLQSKIDEVAGEFEKYKEDVLEERTLFAELRSSREELEMANSRLKEENARISGLEKELGDRKEEIESLNTDIYNLRGDVREHEERIIVGDSTIADLKAELVNTKEQIRNLEKEVIELKSGRPGPKVSANELAKLRFMVRNHANEIEKLTALVDEYERQFKLIEDPDTGQDTKNRLIMDLVNARKEIIKLQKDLKQEQDARNRYSSPENTIVEWAQANSSGELDRVIRYYAENNIHRKRFESGGVELEELAAEYKEFRAFGIEPDVISVKINPREGTATAELSLRLTSEEETKVVRASMVLVREFEHWAILDEGF